MGTETEALRSRWHRWAPNLLQRTAAAPLAITDARATRQGRRSDNHHDCRAEKQFRHDALSWPRPRIVSEYKHGAASRQQDLSATVARTQSTSSQPFGGHHCPFWVRTSNASVAASPRPCVPAHPGTIKQLVSRPPIMGGAGPIVLSNQKGAVLSLSGRQVGLMVNVDLSGMAISLPPKSRIRSTSNHYIESEMTAENGVARLTSFA
jgi:hypothetical protein